MRTIVFSFLCYVLVTAHCFADKVLILAPTVWGGMGSMEAQVAVSLGYSVDVVDATTWSKMQPADFQSYRAIILGDPSCGQLPDVDAAAANRNTWEPLINGNIIIIGGDPNVHPPGGNVLTTNGIRFAVDQAGKTGLYMTLSCYYWNITGTEPVPVLDKLGTFVVTGVGCYNQAHVVATHPAMTDLSDDALSDWDCSVHEGFTVWPSCFIPLAIAAGVGNVFTAPDLSVGTPYILACGQGLVQPTDRILLTPPFANNPTNSQHTVCATVVKGSALATGATVTFNIVSGPNAGYTTQAVTDSTGAACFTYTGTGGVGIDHIRATATDSGGNPVVAVTPEAIKDWFDPCGSIPLGAVITSVMCESNSVFVNFNEIVDPAGALNLANYSLDNGLTVTSVAFTPFSHSQVMVQASKNFVDGTPYTLRISNVFDLCGRELNPNPAILPFLCTPICPSLQCPTNMVVQCVGPGGTKVHYDLQTALGCPNFTVQGYPPSDSLFPAGTTTVRCYATLSGTNGATNFCSFTVTVTDTIPPVIQCSSNIVVSTACAQVRVPYTVTVADNCCTNISLVCTPASNSLFNAGTTTTVNCVATDCNSNVSTCSFTVQVIQLASDTPPVITTCPSNIVICTTNATNLCGIMPDVTSQVLADGGGATLYTSQSIPPGTIVCTNAMVTFTVSNACGDVTNRTAKVLVGPCCCNPIVSLQWPSPLTGITVWEGNGISTPHDFSISPLDPKLLPIPGGPSFSTNDFSDGNGQYYDVYFSDSEGNPETNGCCITVRSFMDDNLLNYDSGGNIDAVELEFADGTTQGASSVGSVQLGQGLTDPTLYYNSGLATNALGLHDGTPAYLGYGSNSITLCYSNACPVSMAIAHIKTNGAPFNGSVFGLNWSDPYLRNWLLFFSTNLHDWSPTSSSNAPVTVTNIGPAVFFRLQQQN